MNSTLHSSMRRLFCFLNHSAKRRTSARRFSSQFAARTVEVDLLESRLLLTAGDLDRSFGVGGHVETEFATFTAASIALASVVQSDGKIIAAGEGGIVRFLPNGALDASFGIGGRIQYPFYARSIALQTNGSIIIGGGTLSNRSLDFVVSRYLNNGTLDTSFDTDGHALVSFGGTYERATGVAVDASGRVIVVGNSDYRSAVARLTTAGALDTTFSDDGLLVKSFAASFTGDSHVAIQPDGKIVLSGTLPDYSSSRSVENLIVMRLNPGGEFDSAFGSDGVATIAGGRTAVGRDLTLLSNGQIVVSGSCAIDLKTNVVVGRLTANGLPDTTFDGDGRAVAGLSLIATIQIGGEAHVVLDDGSIVVSAGNRLVKFGADGIQDTAALKTVFSTNIFDIAALSGDRLLLSGTVSGRFGTTMLKTDRTLDETFSADGLAPVEFGSSNDVVGRSIQQSNARIVVASTSLNTFAVTRYLPNGTLDTTFSQDGKVTIDFGAQFLDAVASDVAVQSNGRIVVVGHVSQLNGISQTSIDNHIAIARLNANGTLDTSFGTNGTIVTRLNGNGRATTVKIQSNGRIVVGGVGNGGFFSMLRYLSNGTLDNSFSRDGIVTTFYSSVVASTLYDLIVQPDGKILTTGDFTGRYSTSLLIARFNTNGTLDTTFGTNGRVLAGSMEQRTGTRLALLSDGSFYVGGNDWRHPLTLPSGQMALSRFTSSGQLIFQKVITPFTENLSANPITTRTRTFNSTLNSIIVQPDGRVVMVGSAGDLPAIVRLNPDGTDDTSFNGDGRTRLTLPATGKYLGADVLIQSHNRLLLVGSFQRENISQSNLLLTRINGESPPAESTRVYQDTDGLIHILDNWSRNDSLRIKIVGSNIQVTDQTTDSQAALFAPFLPQITGSGTKTILIPLSMIQSGQPLIVDTRDGDDSLTLETYLADGGKLNVRYAAGLGFDSLVHTSGNQGAIWELYKHGSGFMTPDGAASQNRFLSVESYSGGLLSDEFRVQAETTSSWTMIDGHAGANDLIQITSDADISISNRLAEIRGRVHQKIAIANFERATLIGGISENFLFAGLFSGRVTLRGGDGDDKLYGSRQDDLLRGEAGHDMLFGYDGNDMLYGGEGDDILSGDWGDDQLFGEDGRDILNGGDGLDKLHGGTGEDLLISGEARSLSSVIENDVDRINIRTAWSDTTRTYNQRVVAIRDTGVGTSNPPSRLTAGSTVDADSDPDQLFGDGGRDWFFATTISPLSIDLLADRQLGEELTLLN